ncbi:MAG: hypothetical protein ACTSWY_03330 [Promethearchaeota archaeon]
MMIDEEDEEIEDLLKRKISWKVILKGTLAFILMGSAYMLIQFSSDWMFFGILIMCLASSLMVPSQKEKRVIRQTLSFLKCDKCSIQQVKDYEEGDFIFKEAGICPKCGNSLKISLIYSVKLKEKEEKKKKDVI